MSDIAIRVEGLGKRYRIGASQAPYRTLRETLVGIASAPARRIRRTLIRGTSVTHDNTIWALKDVSFEVKQGEVLGIIGRNGAGKSTLLKVLSRITKPTEGHADLFGRVGSLLEVGTGFHPELTGRENIFLNGAILGMRRVEIERRFEEIVAFGETENFLDTPVKHYSTGMYLRLAFAVAAHLEPEILLVDEVLAVGDAAFQRKCLGRIGEIARQGRTVLFVSHNMNAIARLCGMCISLENGMLHAFSSDVGSVVRNYLSSAEQADQCEWRRADGDFDNDWFLPTRFSLVDANGNPATPPFSRVDEVWVQLEGEIEVVDPALTIGYAIYSQEGTPLYWSYQTDGDPGDWPQLLPGKNSLRSQLPLDLLNEGSYRLELIGGLHNRKWLFEPQVRAPSILMTVQGALSNSPHFLVRRPVLLAPILKWKRL